MVELADPIIIGGLKVRNRTVMPPMVRNLATDDGYVTQELVEHYAARSKGEVGLIIVEAASIAKEHGIMKRNIGIYDDDMIPGLSTLAEGIKKHGARAFIQINHAGPKSHVATKFVGPSTIPIMKNKIPKALTIEEIENIKSMFVDATRRAKEAGFDGVEIHGAHFYLLSAFLSPFTNNRKDEYGGTIEKRAKFSVDVIRKIRQEIGGYPLLFRMNGIENVKGGITIEEGVKIAKIIEHAGVDAMHVSCVVDAISNPGIPALFDEKTMPEVLRGYPYDSCIPCASKIKQKIKIPVIGVGMVRDGEFARQVIKNGSCDLLGIGRALLADPDFVAKAIDYCDDEIIPWKD
ncbi:MAG: NADH:flavin oxidoreductase [Candidatus Thorarchaeota archaeon]|nr:NADH:flavin oxidoreductase [Candidatus Thorarchaeota archaeon]